MGETHVDDMRDQPVGHLIPGQEAVVFAAKVAIEYRQKFHKPVVIDMFCYRRFGHNEGDEPSFTQPLMYSKIRGHETTLDIYSKRLIGEGLDPDIVLVDWHMPVLTGIEFVAAVRQPPYGFAGLVMLVSTETIVAIPTDATASAGFAPPFWISRTFMPADPTAAGATNTTKLAANCASTHLGKGSFTGENGRIVSAAPR